MQTILAVDDEVENLSMVEFTLQDEYEVVAVNSGMVALQYLQKQKPDLILLDIRMPQMDGFVTMEKIKSIPGLDIVPVIFLTSAQELETEITCFEMGAVDFIRKPFEPKIMKQRVTRTLRLFNQAKEYGMTQQLTREMLNPVKKEDSKIELLVNGIQMYIPEKDIMYVEVYNNNCAIMTEQKEYNVRATLERIQDMLVGDFIRTGRSFLINPKFVVSIDDDIVLMKDKKYIKLPRRNKKELATAITNKM